MREEAGSDSLDSVASSTASGVLIASTSVHMTSSLNKGAAGSSAESRQMKADDSSYGRTDGLKHLVGAHRCPSVSGVCVQKESATGSMRKSYQEVKGASDKGMEIPSSSHYTNLSQASGRQSRQKKPDVDGGGGQGDPSQMGPLNGERSTVHISIRCLREIPAPLPDFAVKKRDHAYIPPALPANKYPPVTLTHMEKPTDVVGDSGVQRNAKSKIGSRSPKVVVMKHFQEDSDKNVTKAMQECSMPKNKDVQISQFTTGQKETLLAALNKRVQGGSVTKEVHVHLLDDAATKSKPSLSSTDKIVGCSEVHSATIAAATAAAVAAAAAPVLKAQSDLEAQVNSVSQLLNRLQEADRQRHADQQSKIHSPLTQRPYQQERISELERQLAQLTEQRLQHLEKLQKQQLELQSHFISSAMMCPQAPTSLCSDAVPKPQPVHQPLDAAPPRNANKVDQPLTEMATDFRKSPLETPAPRRFAPKPISLDVQPPPKVILGKENVVESKNTRNAGKVHFLQQVLGHDGTSQSEAAFRTPLKLTTADDCLLQNDRTGTLRSTNILSGTAVQKADDVLQDLNALKKEIQNMIKLSVPSCMSSTSLHVPPPFWQPAANPPKSMFEDAVRILREVQSNRKVLDENLEAIIRAKDGAAMYSFINALASNRCCWGLGSTEKCQIQDRL